MAKWIQTRELILCALLALLTALSMWGYLLQHGHAYGPFTLPVDTSWADNPVYMCRFGCYPGHRGTDYGPETGIHGQPVVAAAAGYAVPGWDPPPGWGNYVEIEHGRIVPGDNHSYTTLYAHLDPDTEQAPISPGQFDREDVIGHIGQSGGPWSTCSWPCYHLHFEVWRDGGAIDPYDSEDPLSDDYLWAGPLAEDDLRISPPNPRVGQTVEFQLRVRNYASEPIYDGDSIAFRRFRFIGRHPDGLPWMALPSDLCYPTPAGERCPSLAPRELGIFRYYPSFHLEGTWHVDMVQYQKVDTDRSWGYLPANGHVITPTIHIGANEPPTAQPVDVVLVLDRSGSMGTAKMEAAKSAAVQFVRFMRDNDKIGVVSFSSSALLNYPLTTIAGSVKNEAESAILAIQSGGGTSIGAGLQTAHNELNSKGDTNHPWAMVLLSDGDENARPMVADVLPAIVNNPKKIVIHTVGFGAGANEQLMQHLKNETGGTYHFAPSSGDLSRIYNAIAAAVSGQQTVLSGTGTAQQGISDERNVTIDSSVVEATFMVSWLNSTSTIDLLLERPDGNQVDPSTAISGTTFAFYRIEAPDPGLWTMRIIGQSVPHSLDHTSSATEEGEPYTVIVTALAGLTMQTYFDRDDYITGQPIRASVNLFDGQPITGSTVTVTIQSPSLNSSTARVLDRTKSTSHVPPFSEEVATPLVVMSRTTSEFALYDDGNHDDGAADDGVYANTFHETFVEGSYTFSIDSVGTSNTGEAFTRRSEHSIFVAQNPNPSPTVTEINPNTGLTNAPTNVTIIGANFVATPIVLIGNTPATNVTCIDSNTLTAEVSRGIPPGTYDVRVVNPDFQFGVLPDGFTVINPCDQLLTNPSFETDDGWVLDLGFRPAHYVTDRVHSGVRSMFLGIDPALDNIYVDSSVWQEVTIPAEAESATLSFWYWPQNYEPEYPGYTQYDWQEALVKDRAGVRTLATAMRINSNVQTWIEHTYDLTPYRGQTIRLYFNVHNDGRGRTPALMYLDGVIVEVCGPKVLVSPPTQQVGLGNTVNADIRIESVTNVYGADVHLRFDPTKLEVQDADPATPGVQIQAGSFLDAGRGHVTQNRADNLTGEIRYVASLQSPAPPASGNGVLATITFKGIGEGDSPVTLDSVSLSDDQSNPVSARRGDGAIAVIPPSSWGTIAGRVLLQGRNNHGGATVTGPGLPTVRTEADASFALNPVAPGTYTVTATMQGHLPARQPGVSVVAEQTVNLPNVTLLGGDANNDCAINDDDVGIVEAAYGICPASDPRADINGDGCADLYDLVLVQSNYGRSCPMTWSARAAPVPSEASVLASPSSQELISGETTTVEIRLENVTNLYGADVHMRFDPTKLEVVDADPAMPGIQIQSGAFQGSTVLNAVNNGTGEIEYAVALQSPAPPVSGAGVLATVRFKGIGVGSSPINLDDVSLSDDQSNPIPTSTQDATIAVVRPCALSGDVDGNGYVDAQDLMRTVEHWRVSPGDPGLGDVYDIDGDGDIDVADIMQVAAQWGNSCSELFSVRMGRR